MASTPEGKNKREIKRFLKALQAQGLPVYFHMPVQNGMGEPTLDIVGCIKGRFFAVEVKAPGKKPTARQRLTIEDMEAAGAVVLVFDGTNSELEMKRWLARLFV